MKKHHPISRLFWQPLRSNIHLWCTAGIALLSSCQPVTENSATQKILHTEAHTLEQDGIQLTVLTFDRRTTFFTIADKAEGPESSWQSAQDAAAAHQAIAAINGGFFDKKGNLLGLIASKGEKHGHLTNTSLGTGFLIDQPPSLITRDHYRTLESQPKNFLQTGPRLVWDHKITKSLKKGDSRPRSFLLWDGKNYLAFGHAGSCNLAQLAEALANQPIPNFDLKYALNLDGGTSSDLWISSTVKGGGLQRRSWINKPVRNYIILHSAEL